MHIKNKLSKYFLMAACVVSSLALADVPVEDISQNSTSYAAAPAAPDQNSGNDNATSNPTANLTTEQRLQRLENQMQNLVQMNLPQQMTEIMQSIQKIQGQLQVDEHELNELGAQQKTYYKDLDLRIENVEKHISQNMNNKNPRDIVKTSNADPKAAINESELYQRAFQFLGKKQFDQARNGFQTYLQHYPVGNFAANSHYWLGSIFFFQKNNASAEKEFDLLISKFGNAPRIPDAKLKLAMIHMNEKKIAAAKKELLQIKKDYPDSTAAQLASIKIQQLDMQNGPTTNN